MKAKEIRALARENLKQIPKKIYMPMGLLLVVANIIPSVVNQVTDSKSGVGVNIIFFLLEIAAALLTANGYIFFDRWRNKIQKGGEEPNAWCGLTGQHIARLLIYGVIEALIIVTVAVAIAAAVVMRRSRWWGWTSWRPTKPSRLRRSFHAQSAQPARYLAW